MDAIDMSVYLQWVTQGSNRTTRKSDRLGLEAMFHREIERPRGARQADRRYKSSANDNEEPNVTAAPADYLCPNSHFGSHPLYLTTVSTKI